MCNNETMVESLGSWWRSLTHRNDDDEHDADDDTLDDATNALLSMLPLASVVVDDSRSPVGVCAWRGAR